MTNLKPKINVKRKTSTFFFYNLRNSISIIIHC